jgi:hypothetical protein
MTISLATLLVTQTKEQIYEYALGIANAIGLPVSSWQAGDPTRSQLHVEAEMFESLEGTIRGFITSGFLDDATGDWLVILAKQVYGIEVPSPTYATTDVVVTNPTGAVFTDVEEGDWTFKNTTTGKTYHNTTGGTLSAIVGATPGTLTVTVVADEAGSDSSASAGEIDDFVAGPLGLTVSNALAAIGTDAQSEETTRTLCRARNARSSPNGAKGAYVDTALDSSLTGTTAIIDARAYGDSETGDVALYLRGPGGAVAEADRALVETAVLANCTPLCITPTVLSVSNVTVAITYSMKLYSSANKTAAEAAEDVETALESLFAAQPIGGDIVSPATTGFLYRSLIQSTIQSVFSQAFDVSVTVPAGDTALTNAQVAALGTVTASITIVKDPT